MAEFCLPPDDAEEFKRQIISGEIDPVDLARLPSAERRKFFADRFGEPTAIPMNALFEQKLLLKNQQEGMVYWAKKMMGHNKPVREDIFTKVKKLEKALSPNDLTSFLGDLAAKKLGVGITHEEAQKIADLASRVEDTKADMEAGGDRMPYGRAVVALRNYVGQLKNEANKLTLADVKAAPVKALGKAVNIVAGNAKSIKASLDNSAIFRQGWKTLWTHPGIWQHNARQSFVDLVHAFGADTVMDEVNADIISRPTYDLMRQAGLAVGVNEEQFPSSWPEHLPIAGRFYRAGEHAYNAFVRRTRADVFDKYLEIAKDSGVDMDAEQLQSIGKLTNSLTGRGDLGPLENAANVVNNLFFAPRSIKSHIDTLLLHPTDKLTPFARKQAAINLVKIILGSAAVLAIARALKKDSVELDPRSADFGKIKIGHTRFDMSGGMASLATLIAREAMRSTKSSTSGKVTKLNSGKFGASTGMDVLYNFFENKFTPAASLVKDIIKEKTFSGERPTVGNELSNTFMPLPISNYIELRNDPKSAPILIAMIADALGIATNTYGPAQKKPKP